MAHEICKRAWLRLGVVMLAAVITAACSSVRHVPQGEYLLDKVTIDIVDHPKGVGSTDLVNYLRQQPNHKVLGFARLQLGMYNMSGDDSTKWYNRWVRRLGQPPVIFSEELTEASARQLRQALVNRGYMGAAVRVDTTLNPGGKRAEVRYEVTAGTPHRVRRMTYDIADTAVASILMADTARFTLRPGSLLDRDLLDSERTRMAALLRNNGYYSFTKEYITFMADTAAGSYDVDLTLTVNPPRPAAASHATEVMETTVVETAEVEELHRRFKVGRVMFITDYTPGRTPTAEEAGERDTVMTPSGIAVVYGPDRYIRPGALEEQCFIRPGEEYVASEVDRTYESLARLAILRSVNIDMRPSGPSTVDAYIYLTRNKKQGLTLELEGTNSEGDLGFGVGVGYRYRNLGHASNLLTAKFRMNYESLSGNFSGLINNRYTEFAGEVGVTMPKFVFPFLSSAWRRRVRASTETSVSFSYQERPEYTRIIAGAAYKYRWTTRGGRQRRTFDLLDINYVRLPESTIDFINTIAPSNPLLRYAYEDHFIMRMGYTYSLTNRRIASGALKLPMEQPRVFSIRASAEIAGNLLYAISAVTGRPRYDEGEDGSRGVYKILGIPFSQYAKAEVDYTLTRNFPGRRHSIAFHVGAGVAVPYGNSRMVPFEKRFYAGGANGVRGWSVRTLGPGNYDGRNTVADFINQCGDISLDLSVEYRVKLFWVFDGALFVDAGNIWTIHSYPNQPGGMFHLGDVPRQLAAAYGAGLRLDFDYFVLRFDLGMKAHNPALGQQEWPLLHPRWRRDATFHFAVGLPF
ncbi:MAG: BamA/TamA family outer membrane protein [Pseudoflavonifractor sp.]|nr:BamA/TamA family outer membrane protein [Alloprevotella sp.]MCM1116442.1 BamA/TamA family outer membrane protein [Pseudoflavonifractor sp.]